MHDLQRYLVDEFADDYQHGHLSRRDLLRKVLLVTGSAAVTATALAQLGIPTRGAEAANPIPRPPVAGASQPTTPWIPAQDHGTQPPPRITDQNVVDPGDPAIVAGAVTFGGPAGDVYGYLAQPAGDGAYPGVVLVHENRGLIEPNKDIARRYAKEGYVALAVDLVSRAGGTDQYLDDLMQATGFLGRSNPDDLTADLLAGLSYLAGLANVDANRLGASGFCFGGGLVWRMVTATPNLKAAIPYYGPIPPAIDVSTISAAMLGIYAELDPRNTTAVTDLNPQLDAAGVTHMTWIAPSARHAFFNNTDTAYNPDGATEAWRRTLAWFAQYLSA